MRLLISTELQPDTDTEVTERSFQSGSTAPFRPVPRAATGKGLGGPIRLDSGQAHVSGLLTKSRACRTSSMHSHPSSSSLPSINEPKGASGLCWLARLLNPPRANADVTLDSLKARLTQRQLGVGRSVSKPLTAAVRLGVGWNPSRSKTCSLWVWAPDDRKRAICG